MTSRGPDKSSLGTVRKSLDGNNPDLAVQPRAYTGEAVSYRRGAMGGWTPETVPATVETWKLRNEVHGKVPVAVMLDPVARDVITAVEAIMEEGPLHPEFHRPGVADPNSSVGRALMSRLKAVQPTE